MGKWVLMNFMLYRVKPPTPLPLALPPNWYNQATQGRSLA